MAPVELPVAWTIKGTVGAEYPRVPKRVTAV